MFELQSKAGSNSQNIYWYSIKHDGNVEFWSASPGATSAIEQWLFERENEILLKRIAPRWPKVALQRSNSNHE